MDMFLTNGTYYGYLNNLLKSARGNLVRFFDTLRTEEEVEKYSGKVEKARELIDVMIDEVEKRLDEC